MDGRIGRNEDGAMMQEGFFTNQKTALLFFRICRRYKIDDYHDRVALIRELTRRGKASYIRDARTFLQGRNVMRIRGDKDES